MNDEINVPKFMLINGKHVSPQNYEHSCWLLPEISTVYSSFWSRNRVENLHISRGNSIKMPITFWISQANRVESLILILWYHWIENTLLQLFQSCQRFFKYLWKLQLFNLSPFKWESSQVSYSRSYKELVVFPGINCLHFPRNILWDIMADCQRCIHESNSHSTTSAWGTT